jgi:hypothetical protein
MSLARVFRIRESQQIEFRAEAFNLPNLVNLYPPDGTLVSYTFGKPIRLPLPWTALATVVPGMIRESRNLH